MQLEGQKVLVTGATGFIGSHLVGRLAGAKKARVRALARNPEKADRLAETGVEVVQGDLADAASLARAAAGCTIVIHAAAQVSSVPKRETFESSNVAGTRKLLRASHAAGVARFIHLSSIAVFGLAASGEIGDASPRRHCGDPYCDTKLDAEESVMEFQRDGRLQTAILRPSAVYGPGSPLWSVIPLKRARKGKLFVVGGGTGKLNYVYIDNLVDAIVLVAEDDRARGEAFIVNDGATTWREYFEAYARMAGKPGVRSIPLWVAKLWVHYRNLRAGLRGESYRVQRNALGFLVGTAIYRQDQLEERLGHRSRVGLEEGLERTESWFRASGLM